MHDDGRTDHDRGDYDRETQAIAGPIHFANEAIEIAVHDLNPQVVRPRFPRDDCQVAREPMQDAGKLSHGGARVARNRLRLVFGLDQPIDEGRGVGDHLKVRVELPSHALDGGDSLDGMLYRRDPVPQAAGRGPARAAARGLLSKAALHDHSEDDTMTPTRGRIESLVMQIQTAFLENSMLSLTLPAAQRRLGLDGVTCAGVLGALVEARVLTEREGVYRRYVPRPAVRRAA